MNRLLAWAKTTNLLTVSEVLLLLWLATSSAGVLWTSLQANLTAVQVIQSITSRPILVPQGLFRQPVGNADSNARLGHLLAVAFAWQGIPAEDVVAACALGDPVQNEFDRMTRVALAQAYFANGYEEDGRRMLQQTPEAWVWAYNAGTALMQQRKWQEALAWFERALSADASISEQKLDLYLETCWARYNVGDFSGAVAACQWAIQVAPPDNDAYTYTGEVYLNNGKPQPAYEILMAGLAQRPVRLIWHYVLLGRAAQGLGDVVSAREWYERALALNPTDPRPNLYLGILLADMGEYQEAIPYLELVARESSGWGDMARGVLQRIR